jgi:serine O-acetyltransferase
MLNAQHVTERDSARTADRSRNPMTTAPRTVKELRLALASDFARPANQTSPQRLVLCVLRLGQYVACSNRRGPLRWLWRFADRILLRGLLGTEIPPTVRIGPGFAIPHCARNVVIHGETTIGANAMIFQRVVIGVNGQSHAPTIGDGVLISTGACVLGGISVGDGARVCPNALVLLDVPAGAIACGNPARLLRDFAGS